MLADIFLVVSVVGNKTLYYIKKYAFAAAQSVKAGNAVKHFVTLLNSYFGHFTPYVQMLVYHFSQIIRSERLRDIAVHACFIGFLLYARNNVGSKSDYWRKSEIRKFSYVSCCFIAVHIRHMKVKNYHIRTMTKAIFYSL